MPREPALSTSAAESLGVVLCTTTVSRSRRRDGGEGARNAWRSAVGIERAEGRSPQRASGDGAWVAPKR